MCDSDDQDYCDICILAAAGACPDADEFPWETPETAEAKDYYCPPYVFPHTFNRMSSEQKLSLHRLIELGVDVSLRKE